MEEIWKDVPGYEGHYKICIDGRVKAIQRYVDIGIGRKQLKPERILKSAIGSHGYRTVALCNGGQQYSHCVHRLVAASFINNPNGFKYINHKNGVKTDNSLNNLEWVSSSMNNKHAYDTGLKKPFRKITSEQVEDIRKSSLKTCELARIYNVNHATISEIVNYKTRLNG